jgi:hypothetical protein
MARVQERFCAPARLQVSDIVTLYLSRYLNDPLTDDIKLFIPQSHSQTYARVAKKLSADWMPLMYVPTSFLGYILL